MKLKIYNCYTFFNQQKLSFTFRFYQQNKNVVNAISISLIKLYFKFFFQLNRTFQLLVFPYRHIQSIGKIKVFISYPTHIHTYQNNQSQRRFEFRTCFKSISRQYMSFQTQLFALFLHPSSYVSLIDNRPQTNFWKIK